MEYGWTEPEQLTLKHEWKEFIMVRKTLLSIGLLGLLMAGALAIAGESHGTPVSIDEAQNIRGGCVGYSISACSGWKCGTSSLIFAGSGNGDLKPDGEILRCGGSLFNSCSSCMSEIESCGS